MTAKAGRGLGLAREALLLCIAGGLTWCLLFISEYYAVPSWEPPAESVLLYHEALSFDEDGKPKPRTMPHIITFDEAYVFHEPEAGRPDASTFVLPISIRKAQLDQRQAIYFQFSRRMSDIRLNGELIYANSDPAGFTGNGGFTPMAYILPPDHLREGSNTISFSVPPGFSSKVAPLFHVGDAQTLFAAVQWAGLFGNQLAAIAIALMVFVALLFLISFHPRDERIRAASVVGLLLTFSLYNANVLGYPSGLPRQLQTILGHGLALALVAAFAIAVLVRVHAPKWTLATVLALFIGSSLLSAWAVYAGLGYQIAWKVEVWAKMSFSLGLIALLLWSGREARASNSIERIGLIACLLAMLVDGIDDRFGMDVPLVPGLELTFYALPYFGLVLAIAMCASLATQATRARYIALRHNDILEARLSERETQLSNSFEREKQLERDRVVLAERQRIMRDMHDGVGGQLISLIVQARNGDVTPSAMERALNEAVDDIRLIVESLDTAGESLTYALGTFRSRLTPKLRSAGIQFQWDMGPDLLDIELKPDAILQVFRILQQAVSNALEHSGATSLTIGSGLDQQAGAMFVTVDDNGAGFPQKFIAGKGLVSMEQRAKSLGGSLDFSSVNPSGTRVSLRFPLEPNAIDTPRDLPLTNGQA